MHRALLTRPLCHSCRHEVIRSFSSISGTPVIPRYTLPSRPIYSTHSRSFSVSRFRFQDPPVNNHGSPLTEKKPENVESDVPAPSQHIPWYLQEETPATEPVLSREQIPDLPENPPKILPALLEYTFKDLGLDELKLFDLRGLDTPPALGANVIMIIGTARSVKHLNVSADRLCRWLRSTYKLSPYADGLLGRNELKIKLRRKARRARIAAQAGATFDEKDDGITTGWICVNAGVVEEGPAQEQVQEQVFEGFGHTQTGQRIVVQMFTEEKRAEVDLDGLWEATLRRAEREKQRNSEVTSDAPPKEVRSPSTMDPSFSDRDFRHFPRSPVSLPMEQRRRLHSSRQIPHPHSARATATPRSRSQRPTDPAEDAALVQIQLICAGISRQHPTHSKESLWEAFENYISSGYELSDETGYLIVSALLTERPVNTENEESLPVADKELALRVLEHLSLQGINVLNMKVFNMLYKAAGQAEGADPRRVSQMIEALNVPFDPEQARVLMVSLFHNQDYDGFWKIWRKLPLSGSPRTAADYEKIFQLHADLGHEHRARDCVVTWVPMMSREDPPIPIQGPVVQHILYCLLLADPKIQQRAAEGKKTILIRLWNECQKKLTLAV